MYPRSLCVWAAAAGAMEIVRAAAVLSAPIGEAASVVPASSYTRSGAPEKPLAVRDTLEQNDRIRTTSAGSTRVRFLDDTMLTIGPDSEVLLDQFVFDGNRAQKATVEVVRGAMRFVSGTSDRRAYEIKTPAATIGVRGTVVDIGFVNGRWSFNTVDGTITATLASTGETRSFSAGQPGFTIGPSGFIPISPNDANALGRRLDTAHQQLARASGVNPSAPQGAAAGNEGNTDTTGSTGGNQGGNQSNASGPGAANGGPGSGSTSGPSYSTPPNVNIVTVTGTTNPTLAVFADFQAIINASLGPLGPVGTGPGFTANPLSINAIGGDQSDIPVAPVAVQLNRLLLDASVAKWDAGAGQAFRGSVFSGTNPVGNDVNAIALGRVTATVSDLQTVLEFGESGAPLYQIGRWTNGAVGYSQNGGVSGIFAMNANQGLHYIVYGYTGGLMDGSNQFPIGKIVTYSLEHATSPTWIHGTSAPGIMTSGTVAVGFGATRVSYGLEATLNMPGSGTMTIHTPGGIANPHESGAVASSLGGIYGFAAAALIGSGGACVGETTTCGGVVDFVPVAKDRIGAAYIVDVQTTNGFESIEGAAVFRATEDIPANSTGNMTVGAVTQIEGSQYANFASGVAKVVNSAIEIIGFSAGSDLSITRTTATVTDSGRYDSMGWERWKGGDFTSGAATITLPAEGGLHLIYGSPATIPTNLGGATKVQYSFVGGTAPTLSDGTISPGTISANSKMGVDFGASKIGLDLFVSIGAANYHIQTSGGGAALTNSSISELSFSGSGIISGSSLSTISVQGTAEPSCTAGNCIARINGFLAAEEATQAGITYSMKDPLANPYISGAAAFGRDFPASTVGAFGYAHPTNYASVPITMGPTLGFNSSGDSGIDQSVVADNGKASGLSVQSFNLEVNTNTGVFGWHRLDRGAASGYSTDQGVVAGVLGWERLTGTLHQHKSGVGTPPDMVLTANQGVHIIHGVAATNIPTNVTYTYDLAGGTSPTIADGTVAPGQILNTSKVGVNFSSTAPKFGVNLNVDMGSAGAYNIASTGGASAPSLAAPSLHSNGTFNAANIPTTLTSGTNQVCGSGSCTAAVSGFLAGDGAKNLGIIYQFGNASAPGKVVTGAAGFTKTP